MHASEIMSRPVVSISPDAPVRDAVVRITEGGFASLPVVDEEQRVIGMITEVDALRAVEKISSEGGGASLQVSDVMTKPVEVISPDTEVTDIAHLMLTDRLRSLPVVEDGVLVGIVSRRDVLRPLVRPDDVVAAHVSAVLDAYSGQRGRWSVDVTDRTTVVKGEFIDDAERRVVASLARTVPGVVDVRIEPE